MATLKSASQLAGSQAAQFRYRSLDPSFDRPWLNSSVVTLDEEFIGRRKHSYAAVREVYQNFALVAWATKTHLDFTTSFEFQSKTGNKKFDRQFERWMKRHSRMKNFDVAGRMNRQTMLRTSEALQVWDGDSALMKCPHGQFQLLEAWQIAKAENASPDVDNNGLIIDKATGRIQQAAVCGKIDKVIKQMKLVDDENLIWNRHLPKNGTRGASRLLPALNHARDLGDATSYYLLKAKVAAMFGIMIKRSPIRKGNFDFDYMAGGTNGDPKASGKRAPLRFDLKPGLKLELESDEDAKFIESATPPIEFQKFFAIMGRLILACLSIPYSAYDSSASNYAAMRADFTKYRTSTEEDRDLKIEMLDEMTEHMLRWAIIDDELTLPKGWTVEDVESEWIPSATFVIDKPAEVAALIELVAAGITTRQQISKELGYGDIFETLDALGIEQKAIKKNELQITMGKPGAIVTNPDADNGKDEPTDPAQEPQNEDKPK